MGQALRTTAFALGLLIATPFAATAQVADPECSPSAGSTTETLIADLAAIPLPPGCPAIDIKAIGNRLKETEHLGLFTKLKLGLQAKGVFESAKAYDNAKTPSGREKLRRDFNSLFKDFAKALDGKDPQLVREVGCAHAAGFDLLLKGAALENEKERREGAGSSNDFGGSSGG